MIIYTLNYTSTINRFEYINIDGEMNMIPTDTDITLMSLDDKLKLRKSIQKEISIERRNKNLRIETFIPALKINDFINAKEWAFKKKLIPKNTNWAFTKFAVLNTIGLILSEINTEIELQQQKDQIEHNQNVPIQATNQYGLENPKPHTDVPI